MSTSLLAEVTLDFAKAERELEEYKQWLDANAEFTEASIVGFLKPRVNLCLLIQIAVGKGHPDRYKREFALVGVFRADLVVGSTAARHFVLVEFEGGTRDSIFNRKRGTIQMRDWSPELEHGFSQVSDWSWAKNDNQHSSNLQERVRARPLFRDLSCSVWPVHPAQCDGEIETGVAQRQNDNCILPNTLLDLRRPPRPNIDNTGCMACGSSSRRWLILRSCPSTRQRRWRICCRYGIMRCMVSRL